MRVVLIGLGGIGSHLAEPMSRILAYTEHSALNHIILIDGDSYKKENRTRQRFEFSSNKAQATKDKLTVLFPELKIEAKPLFITDDNIYIFIREGDVVLLAVDNHATRKLVSNHVGTLENVLLISGGNDLHDGNIQVYERKNGEDIHTPLTKFHPEIETPQDKNPSELTCEEVAQTGSPQLLTVNFMIAGLLLNAFTLWIQDGKIPYNEQYFDLRTGNIRSVKRS